MNTLYAPWRMPYHAENRENKAKNICVFCEIANSNEDEKNFVFYKDEFIFCVMNKYPYSPGHFLIVPKVHESELEKLSLEIWLRMNQIAQKGVLLLKRFGADGINMGINIGEVGGAGIPKHLHLHLVPRWKNDTNFITTIADTRIYSVDFCDVFAQIKSLAQEIFYS